jgi:2-polyprenyl-3-methyl-5-hydroxy-6-metoxy-1,4-benzoquinol methylase
VLSHEEMISLQAERREIAEPGKFSSNRDFVLHLIHTRAYEQAALYTAEKDVLDLGCHTGYGTRIIRASGARVTGMDVSPEAIDIARKKYGPSGIEFLCLDGRSLPSADRSFDIVTSFKVIEHITDHAQFFAEIRRVVRPGGRLILTTPNAPMRLHPGTKPWDPFHVREFNSEELQALLVRYFPKVEILGLFAVKPIYNVEYERIRILRECARIRQSPEGNSLAGRANLFLLHLQAELGKKIHNLDRRFQQKYTSRDLYYKRDHLDVALDLMAVCTLDPTVSPG